MGISLSLIKDFTKNFIETIKHTANINVKGYSLDPAPATESTNNWAKITEQKNVALIILFHYMFLRKTILFRAN